MTLDNMSLDNMSLDNMSLDNMSLDSMSLDKMTVNDNISPRKISRKDVYRLVHKSYITSFPSYIIGKASPVNITVN